MTHSSFANEKHLKKHSDNERLEFLGDAVLEIVSSEFLYKTYPNKSEGDLTKLRASLVCEPTLALCHKGAGPRKVSVPWKRGGSDWWKKAEFNSFRCTGIRYWSYLFRWWI